MPDIVPCLWYDSEAEEAANFYCGVFPNSKIIHISHYPAGSEEWPSNKPEGSVLMVEFTLDGKPFMALNGGPIFKFNHAISLPIMCKDQKEIDYYWDKLTEGGAEDPCGWLRDKYGLSWQVVPTLLMEYQHSPDQALRKRVMDSYMQMKKYDIETLKKAAAGA